MTDTIRNLVAGRTGPALGQPGRPDLDYPGLLIAIDRVGAAARRARRRPRRRRRDRPAQRPGDGGGVPRRRRHAIAAPLNPAYTRDEFAFYMDDLGAKLLIVAGDTPARAAAESLGSRRRPGPRAAPRATSALDGVAEGDARRYARRTTWRWCCTPRAPRRGRRSCR